MSTPPIPRQPRRVTVGLSSTRSDKGLTIRALAEQLGVSYHHLYKVERGLKRPSDELLLRLAQALDVDLDAISTREPVRSAA
jgi:transcriptional regulator with XRE-family HTH domain